MKSEQGYATPVVLGFISVMSLVAVWAFNLALAQNREVQARQQLLLLQLSFSSIVQEQIFQVLDRPDSVQLGTRHLSVAGVNVVAELSNERSRPNFRYSNAEQLRDDLLRLLPSDANVDRLISVRRSWRGDEAPDSLEELVGNLDLSAQIAACLTENFTVYASTVDPLASGYFSRNAAGAILRINVKTLPAETPSLRIRAIVLFTGNVEQPFEIFEWVEDQQTQNPSCASE